MCEPVRLWPCIATEEIFVPKGLAASAIGSPCSATDAVAGCPLASSHLVKPNMPKPPKRRSNQNIRIARDGTPSALSSKPGAGRVANLDGRNGPVPDRPHLATRHGGRAALNALNAGEAFFDLQTTASYVIIPPGLGSGPVKPSTIGVKTEELTFPACGKRLHAFGRWREPVRSHI